MPGSWIIIGIEDWDGCEEMIVVSISKKWSPREHRGEQTCWILLDCGLLERANENLCIWRSFCFEFWIARNINYMWSLSCMSRYISVSDCKIKRNTEIEYRIRKLKIFRGSEHSRKWWPGRVRSSPYSIYSNNRRTILHKETKFDNQQHANCWSDHRRLSELNPLQLSFIVFKYFA